MAASLIGTSDDLRTAVRWTDGTWLGDPQDPAASRCRPAPSGSRATTGTLLLQPVQRADGGTALVEVFVPDATAAGRA